MFLAVIPAQLCLFLSTFAVLLISLASFQFINILTKITVDSVLLGSLLELHAGDHF